MTQSQDDYSKSIGHPDHVYHAGYHASTFEIAPLKSRRFLPIIYSDGRWHPICGINLSHKDRKWCDNQGKILHISLNTNYIYNQHKTKSLIGPIGSFQNSSIQCIY